MDQATHMTTSRTTHRSTPRGYAMKKLLATVLVAALTLPGSVALADRNASGTYSLPSSYNPVLSGTTITSTWANTTLSDLASNMTSSLDRNGRGGMLSSLRGVDGNSSTPAYSFTSETGLGLFRASSGNLALAVGGVVPFWCSSSGCNLSGLFISATNLTVTATATVNLLAAQSVTASGNVVSGSFVAAAGNVSLSAAAGNVWIAGTNTVAISTGNVLNPITAGNTTVAFGSRRLTSLTDPSGAQDAATRAYVDGKFPALSWVTPALGSGWAATCSGGSTSSEAPAYWKDGSGVVHFKGCAVWSTGGSTQAFSINTGYRPLSYSVFPVAITGVGSTNVVIDGSLGAVRATPTNGWQYHFSSISYVAE